MRTSTGTSAGTARIGENRASIWSSVRSSRGIIWTSASPRRAAPPRRESPVSAPPG
jgi:hypothetical protein